MQFAKIPKSYSENQKTVEQDDDMKAIIMGI